VRGYADLVAAIPLPPRPALARPTEILPPAGAAGHPVAYEPKWDGFRLLVHDGAVWSRHGRDLRRFFPDLAPALAAAIPAGFVVDGEAVCWSQAAGRLDFAALSRRLVAGKGLKAWAAEHPARLVAFDVLADADTDLRPLPLIERQVILADAVEDAGWVVTLCPQTTDLALARTWMSDYLPSGLEGLVAKRLDQAYRPKPEKIWWKYRARWPADLVILGVTGPPAAPAALLLGATDPATGHLVALGASARLTRAAARQLGQDLRTAGVPRLRYLPALPGTTEPVLVQPVEPIVAEFHIDAAIDHGRLRHPARFHRLRPDLEPDTVTIDQLPR